MYGIWRSIHSHRHFIVVVCILLVVMTYPTIIYVFNTEVFWLPIDSGDIWNEFWSAWHFRLLLAGQASITHTDHLFFPQGLSLAYQGYNILHMITFSLFQSVMPASNAYNLTYLLIIFSAALSAYIYLRYLFKNNWAALFGSIVFGFCGFIVGRPMHPNSVLLATLPLSLYFLHRAFLEMRLRHTLMSALLIGVTAFIGLYVFVCLLMTVGAYIFYFAMANWRKRGYWRRVAIVLAFAATFGVLRVYPMLTDVEDLGGVLDKTSGKEQENDLLQFFINYENPFYNRLITNRVTSALVKLPDPGRWNTSYLGYVPLLLIGLGLLSRRRRRDMLPWLALLIPFLLLRLGSALTINGRVFENVLLPKHYLDQMVPVVFEAFYAPDHFQVGALFPLAVLSCFGLQAVLDRVPTKRRKTVVLLLIALLAIEYYRRPPQARIVPNEETAFLEWLAGEEESSIRLINLPMNRGNSKQYLFYQTLSGYPQVEGLATRTPPSAYGYIEGNRILNSWWQKTSIVCVESNLDEFLAALDRLIADGFSHVVLHHRLLKPDTIEHGFAGIDAAHTDAYVSIFRIGSLRDRCP